MKHLTISEKKTAARISADLLLITKYMELNSESSL
jgi:hypothetical protein